MEENYAILCYYIEGICPSMKDCQQGLPEIVQHSINGGQLSCIEWIEKGLKLYTLNDCSHYIVG